MGKHTDPLWIQPRTSRIEKSRPMHRNLRSLPEWYFRVMCIDDVKPSDFDEDLSEIEGGCICDGEDPECDCQLEGEAVEEERGCICDGEDPECDYQIQGDAVEEEGECICDGEDPECNCQVEGEDVEKWYESDRSYDGSDADYYYYYKDLREQRKQEKLQMKLKMQKMKEDDQNNERAKEEEVQAAYASLNGVDREPKEIPLASLVSQRFQMFCSDHFEHFYSDFYTMKRVEFYYLDDEAERSGEAEDMLYGDVYLDPHTYYAFGPFRPPKYASQETIQLPSSEGDELSFQFLGDGYLTLSVSRDMVSKGHKLPPTAPDVFEFFGIWQDMEKLRAERLERMAKEKARRSASPRETWTLAEMLDPFVFHDYSRDF